MIPFLSLIFSSPTCVLSCKMSNKLSVWTSGAFQREADNTCPHAHICSETWYPVKFKLKQQHPNPQSQEIRTLDGRLRGTRASEHTSGWLARDRWRHRGSSNISPSRRKSKLTCGFQSQWPFSLISCHSLHTRFDAFTKYSGSFPSLENNLFTWILYLSLKFLIWEEEASLESMISPNTACRDMCWCHQIKTTEIFSHGCLT